MLGKKTSVWVRLAVRLGIVKLKKKPVPRYPGGLDAMQCIAVLGGSKSAGRCKDCGKMVETFDGGMGKHPISPCMRCNRFTWRIGNEPD